MKTFKISKGLINDQQQEFHITIEGPEGSKNSELVVEGIETLLSSLDAKHMYDEDFSKYQADLERLLFSVLDLIVGDFYYESIPLSEQKYDENEEIVIPKSLKVEYLYQLAKQLKEENN